MELQCIDSFVDEFMKIAGYSGTRALTQQLIERAGFRKAVQAAKASKSKGVPEGFWKMEPTRTAYKAGPGSRAAEEAARTAKGRPRPAVPQGVPAEYAKGVREAKPPVAPAATPAAGRSWAVPAAGLTAATGAGAGGAYLARRNR